MKREYLFTRKALGLTLAILFAFSVTGSSFAQATAITTNDFIPFALVAFVPCANGGAGELVNLSGTLHVQQHITINDNRANLKVHIQPQEFTGVGLVTGDVYHAVGVTQEQDSIPITGGAFEFTTINNFRIIGPGPDNNLQVHQNVHVTTDANGNVTTTVDNTSVDCN